jgi:hypothetical protein
VPATEFVSKLAKSRLEKRPDLALSPQNPLGPIRQRYKDRRRFKYGILCIQRYQAIYVLPHDRFMPTVVDVADFCISIFSHRLAPVGL